MAELVIAYGGLFVWSFLAATVLPLGSEAALVALVRNERGMFAPVLVATIGNYLGSCTTYWLGRRVARAAGARRKNPTWGEKRAAGWLARYGRPALLLSWVPVVGDALVALAGAAGVPFAGFSFWVALGKALRYAAVAWAANSV